MFVIDGQMLWGIAIGAAIMAVGYSLWRSGRPLTPATAEEVVVDIADLAPKIRDVAQEIVEGIQQIKEDGRIDTGSEAFKKALAHLEEWFPQIDPDLLKPFIEAAYRRIKPQEVDTPPTPEGRLINASDPKLLLVPTVGT